MSTVGDSDGQFRMDLEDPVPVEFASITATQIHSGTIPTEKVWDPVAERETFLKVYVSSKELCSELDITRGTLFYAIRSGYVPAPFHIAQLFFWRRDAIVEPLKRWLKEKKPGQAFA